MCGVTVGDHAKFSPSAAERWFTCPGSVVLSKGIPESSSHFAEEGTQAHGLAKKWLLDESRALGYSAEMRDNVRFYVDHVKALAEGQDNILAVEQKVVITDDCWGTADAWIWKPHSETLYVRDLKYGAGVVVEVQDNKQLLSYGLGALLTSGFPAKVVNIGIVQPRIPHPDGPARSKDYQAVDLIDFHADLLDAVDRVKRAELFGDLVARWRVSEKQVDKDAVQEWEGKFLHPSKKACQFCPAAAVCPKVSRLAQEMAKAAFTVATVDNGGVRSYDPRQLSETLDKLPILENWIKSVREFAYAEAEKGHAVPGYKLVPKRPTRKWKNEAEAAETLDMLGIECYGERPMLTPPAVEKLIPRAQQKVLEQLVVKESSGHNLVREDEDDRPGVDLSVKFAFGEISDTAGETESH